MNKRVKIKKDQKEVRLFSYKQLHTRITGYGYEYSFTTFMKSVFLVFSGIIAAGYLYQLDISYILICLTVAVLTLPLIVHAQFKYLYEQKRFSDVTGYMEQMIYSFKKRPKILQSLLSTGDLFESKIGELCKEAAAHIQTGVFRQDIYKEAFAKIEAEYPCERMVSLHRFFSEIEMQGGEYQTSINILLDDIKLWTARTYEYQKERKKIKNYITVAIGLALFICYATTNMMPSDFSVVANPIYQVSTTITIVGMIILFAVIQSKINGTWLQKEQCNDEKIKKDFALALHGVVKAERKKLLPVLGIVALTVAYAVFIKNIPVFSGAMGAGYFLYLHPKTKIKFAKRRTVREIRKQFPLWLLNLSLHLQRENVQVAIQNSIPQCPLILKEPLKRMQEELDNDAVSIRPYNHFLQALDIPELKSAMQMLYALNGAAKKDTVTQINTLVERNTKLLEQGERLKEEDSIALAGFLVALPMILSFIKLVTDIVLIIFSFLEKMAV